MRKRLASLARTFKQELTVYRRALSHPDTPWLARILLGAAVAYALLPFDLIPDFLPVIGHLDDLVIVPALVWLALRLIPAQVMDECRQEIETAIDRQQGRKDA